LGNTERSNMARPNKASTVAEIADHFRGSTAAVLTEYRGLSVAVMTRTLVHHWAGES
jgi:ribosomal protein L10